MEVGRTTIKAAHREYVLSQRNEFVTHSHEFSRRRLSGVYTDPPEPEPLLIREHSRLKEKQHVDGEISGFLLLCGCGARRIPACTTERGGEGQKGRDWRRCHQREGA